MSSETVKLQTGHIGLNVTDLDRSLDFYTGLFQFDTLAKSTDEGRRFAFLGESGGAPVLTLWEQSRGAFSDSVPGLHHLSFQIEDTDQLSAFENRLRERNVPLLYDGVVAHMEGADSGGLFFKDPDGIRLEVFVASGVGEHVCSHAEGAACGFF